jgi:SAM-dependent methyltransferase
MARRSNEANRRYHDRVASRYDSIYDDEYWDFHDRVTWNHLKAYLPTAQARPVMDLGCGTGKWGLKLLKGGHAVTFVDLSNNMLQEVRKKLEEWSKAPDLASKAARAAVMQADAVDLRAFAEGNFDLVTAMGDVVSICSDAGRCLAEVHRVLAPGGIFVFTVDNYLAAIDHFIESGNLRELAAFVKTGRTEWLTKNAEERFEVRMFLPAQIEALTKRCGFEVVSRIGKTIIPARRNRKLFEEERAVETLVELEAILQREPAAVGRASHIQIAARKV